MNKSSMNRSNFMNITLFIPVIVLLSSRGKNIDHPKLIWVLVFFSLINLLFACFFVYLEIQLAKEGSKRQRLLKKEQDLNKQITLIKQELKELEK